MENKEQQTMKVMAVEICGNMGKMYYSAGEFKHRYPSSGYSRTPTNLQVADYALRELEAARHRDVAIHEKNIPAMEVNKIIADRVTALNIEIGMPDGWSERDPSSRARIPKTIRHNAGWKTDLAKHVLVNDRFDHATAQYEKLKADYGKYREQALRDDEQAQRAAERERELVLSKRRADMELATIILRYELPMESEWRDVLDALRTKDQRLDLAVAMEDVRSDWNEGCGAVEYALSRFTIRDNEDKEIAADVLGCTRDFEDGRVFRDTAWSYSALYASVADKQLSTDVQTARGHASNE